MTEHPLLAHVRATREAARWLRDNGHDDEVAAAWIRGEWFNGSAGWGPKGLALICRPAVELLVEPPPTRDGVREYIHLALCDHLESPPPRRPWSWRSELGWWLYGVLVGGAILWALWWAR
jgi:hypothetical protein